MEDRIVAMEKTFERWYSTLTEVQSFSTREFLKEYPLRCIEEDILKFAEENDIEVKVPQAMIFEIEVGDEENKEKIALKNKFISLVKSESDINGKSISFKANLEDIFRKERRKNVDKKITFYCFCPFLENLDIENNIGRYFGIYGIFYTRGVKDQL